MLNSLLFAAVVLIWGSAWIMVKFQIGVVPPEVSVAYRMGSAAAIMFAWSLLRPKPRRLTGEDHLFMALQGALIFSTNFFLFYLAAATLTTGLIAVVFSAASVFTIGIKMLFMGYRPPLRVLAGALLGVVGIGSRLLASGSRADSGPRRRHRPAAQYRRHLEFFAGRYRFSAKPGPWTIRPGVHRLGHGIRSRSFIPFCHGHGQWLYL
jgi:drug/metabolite transporter (DMT)-like permease